MTFDFQMTHTIEEFIRGVWIPIDAHQTREAAEVSVAIKRSLRSHYYQPLRIVETLTEDEKLTDKDQDNG
jgi:hypothetical protein